MAAAMRCACCNDRPVAVIFRPTGRRADDLDLVCDTCVEAVCRECADEAEDGTVTCADCVATAAVRA